MVFTMAAALVITVAGCKHKPVNPTDIPGHTRKSIVEAPANPNDGADRLKIPDAGEGIATSAPVDIKNANGTYDQPSDNSLFKQVMDGPHHGAHWHKGRFFFFGRQGQFPVVPADEFPFQIFVGSVDVFDCRGFKFLGQSSLP